MNLESLQPFADHLWQSTLFAVAAGLLTLVLRNNPARVRHGVWLAASCRFLIPFHALIAFGTHFAWRTAPPIAQSAPLLVADRVSQPFAVSFAAMPVSPVSRGVGDFISILLLGVWVLASV